MTAVVQAGRCYKLRLGGPLGGTPKGVLEIDFTPCPPGPVTAVDPPNGTIDARAPLDPLTAAPLGIDAFTIHWPGGTTDPACYAYCETLIAGHAPNEIFGPVQDNGDDTFTVLLSSPLAPGAFAALTVIHGDDSSSHVLAVSMPANTDGETFVTMTDLDFLTAALSAGAPFDKYRHDLDHSGSLTARDLLRWLDLADGVPGAFNPALGAQSPACHPCCPPAARK